MKKIPSLKNRLYSFILLIIVLFSAISLILFATMLNTNSNYNYILNGLFEYTDLSHQINQAYLEFDNYVQSGSSENYTKYLAHMDSVRASAASIRQNASNEDMYYSAVGLSELIDSYAAQNTEIHSRLNTVSFNQIYPLFTESRTIYSYITTRLTASMRDQSLLSNAAFLELAQNTGTTILLVVICLIALFLFILLFSLHITRDISSPVERIVDYARGISRGNFETEDVTITNLLEMQVLGDTLNHLKHKVNGMIVDLKDQSELELKLKESEMHNHKMANDLKNTEIQILQAQINPHFLFNTLNSISRLALGSGNSDIVDLIEALSRMLRYNLNKIDRPITLREELDNLKNYIYIQQVRFKGKLQVDYHISSAHLDLSVPCLILQPLVENSILHGLEPYNYEGEIIIDIRDQDNATFVSIRDSGVGIPEEKLQSLLTPGAAGNTPASPHHSIGYHNVAGRLEAFFGTDHCISISSAEGAGTTVVIRLEHRKEDR